MINARVPLVICIAILTCSAYGQDLGSSNKLFGGAKPAATAPTKKASSKAKSTAKKSKSTRPSAAAKATAKPKVPAVKPSAAAKATAKPKVPAATSIVKIAPKTTFEE